MSDIVVSSDQTLPLVPIRDGVVYPGTEMILTFGRPRSVSAIEAAHASGKRVILTMQKNASINDPTPGDLFSIGTIGEIVQIMKSDGEINALVRGLAKVEVLAFENVEPFFMVRFRELTDQVEDDDETKALFNHLTGELRRAVKLGKTMDFLTYMNMMSGVGPLQLSYLVAGVLDIKPNERQELIEISSVKTRLELEISHLSRELKVLELEKKIANKTQEKFDKSMREQVLRERIKTIEKELGEDDDNKEFKELEDKMKSANMPEDVLVKAKKELSRLKQMSPYNPEASYLRSYLDWLVELPWSVASPNNVVISDAEAVLDRDHFGLKKMKERIIEYLAVMKLRAHMIDKEEGNKSADPGVPAAPAEPKAKTKPDESKPKGGRSAPTILCFVGPPGVGKTSIGKSIAKALGRKFVKVSLGGIRDEAEIRGHRRTYVGALPGRIIQGIKQAGTKNPVFMLDEIDKVGADFRGDPSSALLEALDPEQNMAFSDHYLEVPFDLSDVFFITTCNILDTIPPALRDRLEVIHFAGYTEDEKFHIVRDFLLEKQRQLHGLPEGSVSISDPAFFEIIRRYTREAGVRNLEREVATVLRKVAKKLADNREGGDQSYAIDVSDIPKYLGPYKFTSTIAEKQNEVGMSTGLAWTQAGGDILFIEVALMPGRGSLILTGQLGDVMKESAQAAMSYVRSKWKELGLPEKFYQKLDIHVHVPEGAVPKDGPSAGAAICTALVSALTKNPVKRTVAMTGEITLRGRVMEIGGVKEKVIAAHRAGIKTVILPKNNQKDMEDIPKSVIEELKFHFIDRVDEAWKIALGKPVGR